MSRLWDLLKKVEQYETEIFDQNVPGDRDVMVERRCGERVCLYSPLLVYGHTTENEPFHERTEGLHVNAGGGLITLTTSVTKGQRLLLINKLDQEQECRDGVRKVEAFNEGCGRRRIHTTCPPFLDRRALMRISAKSTALCLQTVTSCRGISSLRRRETRSQFDGGTTTIEG